MGFVSREPGEWSGKLTVPMRDEWVSIVACDRRDDTIVQTGRTRHFTRLSMEGVRSASAKQRGTLPACPAFHVLGRHIIFLWTITPLLPVLVCQLPHQTKLKQIEFLTLHQNGFIPSYTRGDPATKRAPNSKSQRCMICTQKLWSFSL